MTLPNAPQGFTATVSGNTVALARTADPQNDALQGQGGGTLIASFEIGNYGASPFANPQLTFAQPFAPGDVPSASMVQVRQSDGATVIPSQQDQESTWLQDGSWKTVAVSVIAPDAFPAAVAITTATWSAGMMTIATAAPHNLATGKSAFINGVISSTGTVQCDGVFPVTVIDSKHFSYPLAQNPGTLSLSTNTPGATCGLAVTYQLWSVPGTPNRTPAVTLSQLTGATDIKFLFTGHSLGTDTYAVSVNDIVTNGTNWPWGANPTRGWEVIRSGPLCTEWRFWSCLLRTSDGAVHPWLRGHLFVRVWTPGGSFNPATSPIEIGGYWAQSNIFGPNPGSSGATVEGKTVFTATLQNGNTVLQYFGGPNDPRVAAVGTIPLNKATVKISKGTITLTQAQHVALLGAASYYVSGVSGDPGSPASAGAGGIPVVLSSSGGLPGGVSAGAVYWLTNAQYSIGATGPQVSLSRNRGAALLGNSNVKLTSTGSGQLTITPLATCFPMAAMAAYDTDGRRIWMVNGSPAAKPTVLVAHDFTYLTTRSRCIPPYIASVVVDANGAPFVTPNFSQGSTYFWPEPGNTGDASQDDRIGYLSWHQTNALYKPFDRALQQFCLVTALSYHDYSYWEINETVATLPVVNATNYPNLGTPIGPNARIWPGTSQTTTGIQLSSAASDSGIQSDISGSHQTCPWIIPYLRTADFVYYEAFAMFASSRCTWAYNGQVTVGSVTAYKPWSYYSGYLTGGDPTDGAQVRGIGWLMRIHDLAVHFMPATRPEAQYLRDQLHGNVSISNALWNSNPNYLGIYYGENSGDNVTPYANYTYMHDYMYLCWAMLAWKGEYSEALNIFTSQFYKWCPKRTDQSDPNNPGSIWAINTYLITVAAGNGSVYQTWDEAYTAYCDNPGVIDGDDAMVTITAGSPTITVVASNYDNTGTDTMVNTTFGDFAGIPQIGSFGTNTVTLAPYYGSTTQPVSAHTRKTFSAVATGQSSNGSKISFSSVPAGVVVGMGVYDQTDPTAIPIGDMNGSSGVTTYVTAKTGTSVTVSPPIGAAAGSGGSVAGHTIVFGTIAHFSPSLAELWPGVAVTNSQFPFTDLICDIQTGAEYPSNDSYVCAHTCALALADVLYQATGNAVFSSARGAYNEIRRRQTLVILSDGKTAAPYGQLSFQNFPKYAIGPVGSTQ